MLEQMVLLSNFREVALQKLTMQEYNVLFFKYGLGQWPRMAFPEIAQQLGITLQRVLNLEEAYLAKLSHPSVKRALGIE